MCVLSDKDLWDRIEHQGQRLVYPLGKLAIQPASIDVRLHHVVKVQGSTQGHWIDVDLKEWSASGAAFAIYPNWFILASTYEEVYIPPDLQGQIVGKSSLGRMGLAVEFAGYLDPGFRGQVTLELMNLSAWPIPLTAGMWIAQIAFSKLSRAVLHPYHGKYMNQTGATPSRSA